MFYYYVTHSLLVCEGRHTNQNDSLLDHKSELDKLHISQYSQNLLEKISLVVSIV